MKIYKIECFSKALAFAILCIFGVQSVFAQCSASLFAGGDGTEGNPYQISTPEQLQNLNQCLGESYKNNYYVLDNDIDLTLYLQGAGNNGGEGWKPIGNDDSFYGKFNGNDHKVSGLWINRPAANGVGLFQYVRAGAEIRNVGVDIDNGKGGVVGNSGGGLVGSNGGTISNSYATGNVSGTSSVGGLVGGNSGTIINSYATGNVSGTEYYVGGLVGYDDGTIVNSYATGNVSGNNRIGGLVGNNSGGTISSSYATGSVSGNNEVGGLVGSGSAAIINSYATGNVSGNDNVGGLAGGGSGGSGTIINSYATGNVTGTGNYVGGLAGSVGTISNSYYDKETTGRTDTYGIGKTTAEMKTQSTYLSWDFQGIWEINPAKNNGYPTLLWQNPGHIGSAIVSTIPDQIWTGDSITPKPSISFKGNNLIEYSDFEYTYDNNVQTGTAALKIVGKGSYSGQQANIAVFKIIAATCGTGFAGGTGTEADPYKIAEAENLDAISNCLGFSYSNIYYELQNDIYLGSYIANSSAGWQPIGNISDYSYTRFYGKFNGNGHKVSGLWINRPAANYVGLFGYVVGAVRNVGVEIDNGKGGIVGYSYIGGLVGYKEGGTISNSYATGNVTGNSFDVGGLVGRGDTIINSYATGNVSGTSGIGGLVGSGVTISNSYATGNVTGNYNVGGLVGSGNGNGTIINSYATGNVSCNNYYVGGLVGQNSGSTIINSYYDKETTGRTDTYNGIGKTTTEMKTQSTYEGWDFENTWIFASNLNNGYPILQWQLQDILTKYPIVSYIPPQPYTGSAIEPAFTVTFNKNILTKGSDYTFSYSNNVNAGTAKITITCIGSYAHLGSIEANFAIASPTPIFPNRENPKISRIGVQTTTNTILLSNLPQNAKVEVFNLLGKRIYSTTSHSPLATSHLKIEVQTKGMYIVKAGTQTMRVAVR